MHVLRADSAELMSARVRDWCGGAWQVWVEVDVLDLDGGRPLRTPPLRKGSGKSLDLAFSALLPVNAANGHLDSLRRVLASSDEQESDLYFTLKGRGTRGDKDLAQGFINLRDILKARRRGAHRHRSHLLLERRAAPAAGLRCACALIAS